MTTPRGNLPPINFAEKSPTEIEASIITSYEALSGRNLSPGDPVRLFLLSVAAIIIQQRSIIDFAAKQNLLSYAQGEYIDYLGELVGVQRLPAQKSITTIEFRLTASLGTVYTVPAGTLVTTGTLNFATVSPLNIPIGSLTGTVSAQCTIAGAVGNDLLPGQIRTLVNPLPNVQSATNITTSQGGSDSESDDSLVDRIRLAPSSFSVAGPVDAYVFWSLTANPAIIDVAVSSPTPGVVDIRPLLDGGVIPGQDVLDQVDAVVSADDIRPLTDDVQVNAPTGVDYDLSIEYWIKSSDSSRSLAIQSAVNAAVQDFITWQKSKIGRDINPDHLVQRVIAAGAKRVVINSPSFTVLDETEVAQDDEVTVVYQGLEDA